MYVSVTAGGTREEVAAKLEHEFDRTGSEEAKVKNPIIAALAAQVLALPAGTVSVSVSMSASLSYSLPAQAE